MVNCQIKAPYYKNCDVSKIIQGIDLNEKNLHIIPKKKKNQLIHGFVREKNRHIHGFAQFLLTCFNFLPPGILKLNTSETRLKLQASLLQNLSLFTFKVMIRS